MTDAYPTNWLRHEASGDIILTLHIQPGAKQTAIVGQHGEALKICLAAPPVDGKANDGLIEFLSKKLNVPRAQIELVSGVSARQKRVRISGVSPNAIARLQEKVQVHHAAALPEAISTKATSKQ